jgi:hypothetical protein
MKFFEYAKPLDAGTLIVAAFALKRQCPDCAQITMSADTALISLGLSLSAEHKKHAGVVSPHQQ